MYVDQQPGRLARDCCRAGVFQDKLGVGLWISLILPRLASEYCFISVDRVGYYFSDQRKDKKIGYAYQSDRSMGIKYRRLRLSKNCILKSRRKLKKLYYAKLVFTLNIKFDKSTIAKYFISAE